MILKMHRLKVNEKYYNLLKAGVKIIELRLYDGKRKSIKVGDVIEFSNNSDVEDKFSACVIKLHRADDFAALSKKICCCDAGFDNNEELIKTMAEFYSLERQNEFGVIGIEVKKI